MPRKKALRKKERFSIFSPAAFLLLIILQIVFILFMVGQLFLVYPYPSRTSAKIHSDAALRFNDYDFKVVLLGDEHYKLYLANDDAKKVQGLSNTQTMDTFEGMAFILESPQKPGFWMKDMKFALDFVYLKDGIVVDLIHNVSPDTYPESITPNEISDVVIEINAGQIDESGIQIGDIVDL